MLLSFYAHFFLDDGVLERTISSQEFCILFSNEMLY